MFNGQSDIPAGWAICDGNNGTPDLINHFIKGGAELKSINPEGVEWDENNINNIKLTKSNTIEPKSYSMIFIMKIMDFAQIE
jgi:hypothetical protein